MAARIITTLLLLCSLSAQSQVTSDVKDIQVAKQKLQIGTDATKYLSSILETISVAATHHQSPTAKAVYDYIQTIRTLTGDVSGTLPATTVVAIQGNPVSAGTPANLQNVLRWSGTAWVANGVNLYDIVTTSQTVNARYNQVWVDDLSAGITLNLPACNSANDKVSIQVAKAGADTYAVTIEPGGSEEFADGETEKKLFSQGTGIICTCRWTGSVGFWLFINM